MLVEAMAQLEVQPEKVESMKATAKLINKNPPNVQWMLTCLAQMKSDHEIFGKNYVAPKLDRGGAQLIMPDVSNITEFFTGLPIKSHNGKRFINLVDPETRRKIKMEKLRARVEKARAAIVLEEKKERSRKEKLRVLELNELS